MHLHEEREDTSTVDAIREDFELASVLFYQLLGNHEAQTDTLVVEVGRAEQFAKLFAEFGDLVLGDTAAIVTDLNLEQSFSFVKAG